MYAYFCEGICLYVGKGHGYRAVEHLKFQGKQNKPSDEDWKTYITKPRTAVSAINRVWLLGKPLTLYVSGKEEISSA